MRSIRSHCEERARLSRWVRRRSVRAEPFGLSLGELADELVVEVIELRPNLLRHSLGEDVGTAIDVLLQAGIEVLVLPPLLHRILVVELDLGYEKSCEPPSVLVSLVGLFELGRRRRCRGDTRPRSGLRRRRWRRRRRSDLDLRCRRRWWRRWRRWFRLRLRLRRRRRSDLDLRCRLGGAEAAEALASAPARRSVEEAEEAGVVRPRPWAPASAEVAEVRALAPRPWADAGFALALGLGFRRSHGGRWRRGRRRRRRGLMRLACGLYGRASLDLWKRSRARELEGREARARGLRVGPHSPNDQTNGRCRDDDAGDNDLEWGHNLRSPREMKVGLQRLSRNCACPRSTCREEGAWKPRPSYHRELTFEHKGSDLRI